YNSWRAFVRTTNADCMDVELVQGGMTTVFQCRPIRSEPDLSYRVRQTDQKQTAPTVTTIAHMPGTVVDVLVQAGDRVKMEQPLAILEAMKMEHALVSPVNGTVITVKVL